MEFFLTRSLDLPQVDLMNFRVEYVRPRSGRCFGVLNKQDKGLFRKSTCSCTKQFFLSRDLCTQDIFSPCVMHILC